MYKRIFLGVSALALTLAQAQERQNSRKRLKKRLPS